MDRLNSQTRRCAPEKRTTDILPPKRRTAAPVTGAAAEKAGKQNRGGEIRKIRQHGIAALVRLAAGNAALKQNRLRVAAAPRCDRIPSSQKEEETLFPAKEKQAADGKKPASRNIVSRVMI